MTTKNEIPLIISTALATNIAVDGGAILGAFIGAVLYVTIASDSSIKQRVVFMLAAFTAGYLGSPVLDNFPTGFMAFLISAGIIGVVVLFHKVLDKIEINDLIEIIKRWKP